LSGGQGSTIHEALRLLGDDDCELAEKSDQPDVNAMKTPAPTSPQSLTKVQRMLQYKPPPAVPQQSTAKPKVEKKNAKPKPKAKGKAKGKSSSAKKDARAERSAKAQREKSGKRGSFKRVKKNQPSVDLTGVDLPAEALPVGPTGKWSYTLYKGDAAIEVNLKGRKFWIARPACEKRTHTWNQYDTVAAAWEAAKQAAKW
jgi:hypothetical protein